jgi:hypothetical protein
MHKKQEEASSSRGGADFTSKGGGRRVAVPDPEHTHAFRTPTYSKDVPVYPIKTYWGEGGGVEVYFRSVSASALTGADWSASRSG